MKKRLNKYKRKERKKQGSYHVLENGFGKKKRHHIIRLNEVWWKRKFYFIMKELVNVKPILNYFKKENIVKVKVNGVELTLVKNYYFTTNRVALSLIDEEGFHYATITYNDPAVALSEDEILVKTWSENEFVLELLETGLFEDTGRRAPAGFCEGQVWKIKFNINDVMEG